MCAPWKSAPFWRWLAISAIACVPPRKSGCDVLRYAPSIASRFPTISDAGAAHARVTTRAELHPPAQHGEALELRRQARREHPPELGGDGVDGVDARRAEQLDLAAGEHLERHLGDEERRARPRRLLDRVGDVVVGEAGARVKRRQRVVEVAAEDRVDPRAALELAALARRALHPADVPSIASQ